MAGAMSMLTEIWEHIEQQLSPVLDNNIVTQVEPLPCECMTLLHALSVVGGEHEQLFRKKYKVYALWVDDDLDSLIPRSPSVTIKCDERGLMAVTKTGNLLVSTSGKASIVSVADGSVMSTFALELGTFPIESDSQFTVDSDGRLWRCICSLKRGFCFAEDGHVLQTFTLSFYPKSLGFLSDGRMVVCGRSSEKDPFLSDSGILFS